MSLDGRSGGVAIARLDEHEQRTVMYVAVLPNLLISLHPDYVMTHLLTPLSPDRTRITCSWAFPAEVASAEGFDPAYAVDFWDLTNRQDWSACESVQRGMKAPALRARARWRPTRTASTTSSRYVARAYQGTTPAHSPRPTGRLSVSQTWSLQRGRACSGRLPRTHIT